MTGVPFSVHRGPAADPDERARLLAATGPDGDGASDRQQAADRWRVNTATTGAV